MSPRGERSRKAAARKAGAERQARYRASGRQIAVVIRDAELLAELDLLTSERGSVRAAVETALLHHALHRVAAGD